MILHRSVQSKRLVIPVSMAVSGFKGRRRGRFPGDLEKSISFVRTVARFGNADSRGARLVSGALEEHTVYEPEAHFAYLKYGVRAS